MRAARGGVAGIRRAEVAVVAVDWRILDTVAIVSAREGVPHQAIAEIQIAAVGGVVTTGRLGGHAVVSSRTTLLGFRVAARDAVVQGIATYLAVQTASFRDVAAGLGAWDADVSDRRCELTTL